MQAADEDTPGVYEGNRVLLFICMDFPVEALRVSACRGTLRKCGQQLSTGGSSPFSGLAPNFEYFPQRVKLGFLKSLIAFLLLGHV